ncbi:hypothetical protein DPMN_088957 [Dreissena polymorpha]|uniref:Uncharacterized protein n=1 Tax=Dreissena polymorpha TaxID=45954 RepID=A0A9D4KVH3_DREPO|nr:hypothetical protein DPMN_088957 [Dreissena polymorpha]
MRDRDGCEQRVTGLSKVYWKGNLAVKSSNIVFAVIPLLLLNGCLALDLKVCMKTCINQKDLPIQSICPEIRACDWICEAYYKNCPGNTKYHCAKSATTGNYTRECALPVTCTEGTEPVITKKNGSPVVYCVPCPDKMYYNSAKNLTRLFSEKTRDYVCIPKCPFGFNRTKLSDECKNLTGLTTSAPISDITEKRPSTEPATTSPPISTSIKNEKPPQDNYSETKNKGIIIAVAVGVTATIVTTASDDDGVTSSIVADSLAYCVSGLVEEVTWVPTADLINSITKISRPNPTKLDQKGYTGLLLDLLSIKHNPHTTHSRRLLNHVSDFRLIISTYTRALYNLSSTKWTSARSPPDLHTTRSNQEVIVYGRVAVRKPDQCPPTRLPSTTHADRTRPVPNRLVGLDRVDLIGSGNPA